MGILAKLAQLRRIFSLINGAATLAWWMIRLGTGRLSPLLAWAWRTVKRAKVGKGDE